MKREMDLGEGYPSIGEIEGILKTVTVNGQPHCAVRDAVSDHAVRCYFEKEQLEATKNALGQRVLVHGIVHRDPHGRPTTLMKIDQLRLIGSVGKESSSVRDLAGTYSGFGNVDDFLKEVRGE